MEFIMLWLVFASINLAATISPGPAFVITLRNAMAYDRKTGIFTAIGLGLGVAIHAIFALAGIAVILAQSVFIFNVIKYIGATYLIYIGIKALQANKHNNKAVNAQKQSNGKTNISTYKALQIGFLTNVLNPKALVFFPAFYMQFISSETSLTWLTAFGITSILTEIIWFSLVTIVLTNPHIKARFMRIAHWIERICGGLLLALGVRLALSKIH